jgi:3-hydroxyanthranilate 3,4-dioxygenase
MKDLRVDRLVSIDELRQKAAEKFGGALAALSLFPESQFETVLVRGPNRRNDFHVDPYDELFIQLEGTICVDTREEGVGLVRQHIRAGQLFVVPAGVPHSPLRPAGTWGLVVEIRRKPGDVEAAEWYCHNCDALIERVTMESSEMVTSLSAILNAFQASEERRTCGACGSVLPVPQEFALDGPR